MPLLERPDTRISYHVTGEGRPLLLSHGFAATSAMFSGNLPALARRHRVVTWDLRGHGASDSPTDPAAYSTEACVADMVALLDHLGIERAVVGGHSLGGYLSLELALASPERVEALVLIDTGPGFRRDDARRAWNEMAERYALALDERGPDGIPAGEELHADSHRDVAGLARAARGILVQSDSHVLDGLPSITVPVLVIVGANDKGFLAGSDYMAAKIADARLVVIPDAGHAPNISQPARFDADVLAFLDELPLWT